MGLALRNPSEPTSLTEHRYLPGRPGTEGQNPHAKHHRRPLSWATPKLDAAHLKVLEALEQGHGPLQGSLPQDFPRHKQHLIKVAQANHRLHREYSKYWQDHSRRTRTHLPKAYRQGYAESINGGQALARSGLFPLDHCPQAQEVRGRSRSGSRSRSSSPPSLDREDAFRDPLTTKKRSHRTMALVSPEEADVAELYRLGLLYDDEVSNRHDDEQQVRELYQMGLLYDDEHERGSGFTFDAISHDEPIYKVNIDTRPAKRGRKGGRNGHYTKTEERSAGLEDLPLDLSYAVLSEDAELAAFLKPPPSAEEILHDSDLGVSASAAPKRKGTVGGANEPLMVIYELEDDDYSQEDTSDAGNSADLLDNFKDGNASERGEDEENETWAFINGNGGDDYDNTGSNADEISMTADEQEPWIHIHHHHHHHHHHHQSPDLGPTLHQTERYEIGQFQEEIRERITICSGRMS